MEEIQFFQEEKVQENDKLVKKGTSLGITQARGILIPKMSHMIRSYPTQYDKIGPKILNTATLH